MATRIGVIADTHCPEFLDRLPDSIGTAFERVDLILHAGDVNGQSTLDELGRLAPVHAVRGDHDHALVSLPPYRELSVEDKRIVVIHGQRSRWLEEPQTLVWTLSLGYYHPHGGLARALRRRFPAADVIVYGHTHRPHIEMVEGVLLFNPGGVHQWNPETTRRRLNQKPGWFEWSWLQFARHLRSYAAPTVGIIEVAQGRVMPRVIPL